VVDEEEVVEETGEGKGELKGIRRSRNR